MVSLDSVGDNEALPTLLNPLRRKIGEACADGAYDTKASHSGTEEQSLQAYYPSAKQGRLVGRWTSSQRSGLRFESGRGALNLWKHEKGYHQCSLSETTIYRYKQLLSPKVAMRD